MKMADLTAFFQSKLLSKSEKNLEKIGHQDEPKMVPDQVKKNKIYLLLLFI